MPEPNPVIIFHGRNEFEAQIARDVLLSAAIPVLHLPSLSTGIFGVPTTTRVAVPEDYVDRALKTLREAGLEAGREERAKGLAAFRETVEERFPLHRASPLPAGSRLARVLVALALFIVILLWFAYFRGK
jgi:hypothetical protein